MGVGGWGWMEREKREERERRGYHDAPRRRVERYRTELERARRYKRNRKRCIQRKKRQRE